MRICFNAFFLQNHLGGIGNYAYHLIREIRRLHPDWQLHLLVHSGTAPGFRSLEGVNLIVKDIRGRNARLAYFHLVFPFLARRFDLLHSVGNMGMMFCPIRQVITIHDLYEQVSPERFHLLKRFLMKFLIARSGRGAAAIVADSESTRRDIGRFYPRLLSKTRVVLLGNKFPVAPGIAAAAGDRRHFVFVGTLEPGKNLAHLLQAFARLPDRGGHRLKVVGAEGWGQSALPGLLDSLGIRGEVDFLGYIPEADLRAIYASSLALVLPSSYEGFGLPVIEAMACGCPAICARNSSLVEAGGDAALFFETGDIAGLAARMGQAMGDPALRGEMVAKGYLHAARFRWEKTAAETAAVYGSAGEA